MGALKKLRRKSRSKFKTLKKEGNLKNNLEIF